MNVDVIPFIQSPESLLNLSRDKGLDNLYKIALNRPIIFHIFSLNGASALYKSFTLNDKLFDLKKLSNTNDKDLKLILRPNLDIRGMIYDCTPGTVNRSLYHRAFSSALFPHYPKFKSIASLCLTPIFDLFLLLASKHRKMSTIQLKSFYNDPLKFPSLFFASKSDDLIPYTDVMAYANKVKQCGVPIQTCIFKDSTHVKGYHDHRLFYKRTVSEFAKTCFYDPYCLINKSFDDCVY